MENIDTLAKSYNKVIKRFLKDPEKIIRKKPWLENYYRVTIKKFLNN